MANVNTTNTFSSSTGLTVGSAISFFTASGVPSDQVLYEAEVSFQAETLTSQVVTFPIQSDGVNIIPTAVKCYSPTGLAFVGGTTPTVTAQLQLKPQTGSTQNASAAAALVSSGTTALIAGQELSVSCSPPQAGNRNVSNPQDTWQIAIAFTGAPTSVSGTVKFLVAAIEVPI